MKTVTTKEKKSMVTYSGTLYQKVGKRYHPVRDSHAYDGLGNGSWLVVVDEGCTSIRQSLTPDTAAVEVAFKITEERLVRILAKASEARFSEKIEMTPREQKAVKAYQKAIGEEKTLYFEYDSLYGMAQTILKELRRSGKE